MLHSRIIELAGGQDRYHADNRATVGALGQGTNAGPGYRELFVAHYGTIRSLCLRSEQPGLAVFAVHRPTAALHGSLVLPAAIGEVRSAVVGRHARCDLFLAADPSVSLRHLLFAVEPVRSWARGRTDLAYRVFDLRTESGFRGEQQQRLRSIACEGPAFVGIGNYALLCLVTGDSGDFPPRAEDAWACLPERVYVRESSSHGKLTGTGRTSDAAKYRMSAIKIMPVPVAYENGLVDHGDPSVGVLHVSNGARRHTLEIGSRALERGVFLGRADRCDANAASVLGDDHTSRVHAVILTIDGAVHAIDAASTNGTAWRLPESDARAEPLRARRLGPRALLTLGHGTAQALWLSSAGRVPG